MTNHVTLDQFEKMAVNDASRLPIDMLYLLETDVRETLKRAKTLSDKLQMVYRARFGDTAEGERKGETGTVRLYDGDFTIECDKPKTVKWDSAKLLAFGMKKKTEGKNPKEYIDVKATVPENRFKAWPSELQAEVEDARTVTSGKESFSILMGGRK